MSIRQKLFLGFATILLLFILVSGATFFKTNHVTDTENRLFQLRFPTLLAGQQLTDGIHLSLAGLRGYMILGKNPKAAAKFKAERQQGWQQIDQAIQQLDDFARQWTDPDNVTRLQQIKKLLQRFRTTQQQVEDIVHTPANIPALQLLNEKAAPIAEQLLTALTGMIDEESRLEATPARKRLLKQLADSRGSFAGGMADLRAYLLTGNADYQQSFTKKWQINNQRLKQIAKHADLFNHKQQQFWRQYQQSHQAFSPLPAQIFKLRQQPDWNLANTWLGTRAAPTADAILTTLQNMTQSQQQLARQDLDSLQTASSQLQWTVLAGVLLALLVGIGVALWVSNSITQPLHRILMRAKAISEGDLSQPDLPVNGKDELAELTRTTNQMNHNLKKVIDQLAKTAQKISQSSTSLTDTPYVNIPVA
ncbi:MCP four helix bundle domain-containing protein [methane-oxidizing endosymbiont of Gigantopelta aegis]|uniref:MCP four helix bundle domain-containing protein n=1 Tax=methane-oxidizing endosymbiont of Gigantopelta aegis TaxID=2794938 RepID=UPI0018DDD717|nr:MCP four helix bundle domain-containing protein [methane-oxidizing endosymbiont of Gigantopelta aegis]